MNLDNLENNIKLGQQIFEAVPEEIQPTWGGNLLKIFEDYLENIPKEITELAGIISDKNKWVNAHSQFSKIRKFSLNNRKYEPESYILLAENVAKVTYNSSGLSAPFDHNSGWWIPLNAKRTADYFENEELKAEVKRILTVNLK